MGIEADLNDVLAHYGIKGMRWGVRRTNEQLDGAHDVTLRTAPGKRIKATGGRERPTHHDAKSAAVLRQRAKRSTTDSLSNAELRQLIERMNLERQYSSLKNDRANPVAKFLSKLLLDQGKKQAGSISAEQGAKLIAALKKR